MSRQPEPNGTMSAIIRSILKRLARIENSQIFTGRIGNGGLLEPIVPGIAMPFGTSFGLTTSLVELAGIDVTVPDGCTRLLTLAYSSVFAVNPNTSGGADGTGTDAISVRTDVGGYYSGWSPQGLSGNGGFTTQNSVLAVLLEGLTPGDTVRLSTRGMSNYQPLAANASNIALLAAELKWMR